MQKIDLLPCPFCGGEARLNTTRSYAIEMVCVKCKDCYRSKENAGGAMSEELEAMEDESDG